MWVKSRTFALANYKRQFLCTLMLKGAVLVC